jgi:hypothetical protein
VKGVVSDKAEVLFISYLDDNEVCMMFHNKENDQVKDRFPLVVWSTFINA